MRQVMYSASACVFHAAALCCAKDVFGQDVWYGKTLNPQCDVCCAANCIRPSSQGVYTYVPGVLYTPCHVIMGHLFFPCIGQLNIQNPKSTHGVP
jgi:hypothetical protein